MVTILKKYPLGILLSIALAILCIFIASFIPLGLISGGVFALLIGMALNPLVKKCGLFDAGLKFTSKRVLKYAIILMGATLSFSQILQVGGYSLFVMMFTLLAAFGFGYLFGRLFKMDWKLTTLISAGTGICGGSAIAALSPTIEAKDSDIAYSISATFIFDIIMVIIFPVLGHAFGMSDMGYGLWTGTAVNDTSSVVAAGFAFSDAAGEYAVIVKLTRTLSIIPIVIIFSFINIAVKKKQFATGQINQMTKPKIKWLKIFPWFILGFLLLVLFRSVNFIPDVAVGHISSISKLLLTAALAAIGLSTNFKAVFKSGFKPMLHGFIISTLVVIIAILAQMLLGQI